MCAFVTAASSVLMTTIREPAAGAARGLLFVAHPANPIAASINRTRRLRKLMPTIIPLERVDPRHLASDHQLVDGLCSLVGNHRFEVQRMPDRAVLGRDAGAAEDVAA